MALANSLFFVSQSTTVKIIQKRVKWVISNQEPLHVWGDLIDQGGPPIWHLKKEHSWSIGPFWQNHCKSHSTFCQGKSVKNKLFGFWPLPNCMGIFASSPPLPNPQTFIHILHMTPTPKKKDPFMHILHMTPPTTSRPEGRFPRLICIVNRLMGLFLWLD